MNAIVNQFAKAVIPAKAGIHFHADGFSLAQASHRSTSPTGEWASVDLNSERNNLRLNAPE